MEKIFGHPKIVRLELDDTFPPFIPTPIQQLPAAISNWQAVTPLLTIQEEVLSPPSLGSLSIMSPAPPATSSPPVLQQSQSHHSNIIIEPHYNSLGSSRSPVPLSPQNNPSTGTVLFTPDPPSPAHLLSPAAPPGGQYYASSPQPQAHSPFLQPPALRSRSASPAATETTNLVTNLAIPDLFDDIDIADLLGANNYGTNNIVTDGHKPQIRRQSKDKFAQGKTKPKESAIEEKMSNLSL